MRCIETYWRWEGCDMRKPCPSIATARWEGSLSAFHLAVSWSSSARRAAWRASSLATWPAIDSVEMYTRA